MEAIKDSFHYTIPDATSDVVDIVMADRDAEQIENLLEQWEEMFWCFFVSSVIRSLPPLNLITFSFLSSDISSLNECLSYTLFLCIYSRICDMIRMDMHLNKLRRLAMKRYPCCGYLTINDADEIITDICEVCFWQYDEVAQDNPDRVIGANKISLNIAKKNYKLLGAVEERFLDIVRPLHEDER